MRSWDRVRWVTDEDGLRCYFSEFASGGLSRWECYRRLLAEPDRMNQCKDQMIDLRRAPMVCVRRLMDAIELANIVGTASCWVPWTRSWASRRWFVDDDRGCK